MSNYNHGPWLLAVFTVNCQSVRTAYVSSALKNRAYTHELDVDNCIIW